MAPTVMVTTRKRVRSCQAINLGIVLLSVVLLPLVVAFGSQSGPTDPVKTEPRVNPEPVNSGNSQQTGNSLDPAAVEKADALIKQAKDGLDIHRFKIALIFAKQMKAKSPKELRAILFYYQKIFTVLNDLEKSAHKLKDSTNPSDQEKAQKKCDELNSRLDVLETRFPEDDDLEVKFKTVHAKANDDEIKIVMDAIDVFTNPLGAFMGKQQDLNIKQLDADFQDLKRKVEDLFEEDAKKLIALADRTHKKLPIKVILIFAKQIKTEPTGQFVANLLQEYEEIDKAVKSLKSAAQIWKGSTNPSDQGKAQKEFDEFKAKLDEFEKRYPEDELDSKFVAVRQKASDDEYKPVDQLVGSTFQLVKAFKGNNQDQVNQIDSTFQELKSKVEDLYTKYDSPASVVPVSIPPPAGSSCGLGSCVLYGGAAAVIAGALWYSPALLNWAKNQFGWGPSVPETTEMDPTTTTEPSSTDSASEASELWIIFAVVALIAALAVAFYYFVVRKRTSSSQDTEGATASDGAPTGKTQQATGDKSTQAPVTATPSTGTSTTPSGNVKSKTGAQRSAKASPSTASSGAITSSKASAQEKPKSIRATSSKVPSGTPKA